MGCSHGVAIWEEKVREIALVEGEVKGKECEIKVMARLPVGRLIGCLGVEKDDYVNNCEKRIHEKEKRSSTNVNRDSSMT